MRRFSPYLTRVLIRTPITPNGVTVADDPRSGLAAAALLTLPGIGCRRSGRSLLIQLQMLLDCSDGEVARWRGVSSPAGIYLDRVGHYLTEALLPIALGIRADGGWDRSAAGRPLGPASSPCWCCWIKSETALVARRAGRVRAAAGQGHRGGRGAAWRRAAPRCAARPAALPFFRAFVAIEFTLLALAAAIVDAIVGDLDGTRAAGHRADPGRGDHRGRAPAGDPHLEPAAMTHVRLRRPHARARGPTSCALALESLLAPARGGARHRRRGQRLGSRGPAGRRARRRARRRTSASRRRATPASAHVARRAAVLPRRRREPRRRRRARARRARGSPPTRRSAPLQLGVAPRDGGAPLARLGAAAARRRPRAAQRRRRSLWEGAVAVRRARVRCRSAAGRPSSASCTRASTSPGGSWTPASACTTRATSCALHPPPAPVAAGARTRYSAYYGARNRVWLARRHLPLPLGVALRRYLRGAHAAASSNGTSQALRGYRDGVRGPYPERRKLRARTLWRMARVGRPPVI